MSINTINTIKRALNQKLMEEKNRFKIIAYKNVLNQLDKIENDEAQIKDIETLKDEYNITGIGKSIQKIIEDIISGKTKVILDKRVEAINKFKEIMSVGIVKATSLVDLHDIYTIEDLKNKIKTNKKILNDKQLIGLKYYEDFNKKIPRKEMDSHRDLIDNAINTIKDLKISKGNIIKHEIVGSYRRGAKNSGDIDILITDKIGENVLDEFITKLKSMNYLIDDFAHGAQKYMGVGKLSDVARRVDILYVKPEEYPFALLYFTGSKLFNIKMRKIALDKGFTMNEHGLKIKNSNDDVFVKTNVKTEKDIFKYLEMEYTKPVDR